MVFLQAIAFLLFLRHTFFGIFRHCRSFITVSPQSFEVFWTNTVLVCHLICRCGWCLCRSPSYLFTCLLILYWPVLQCLLLCPEVTLVNFISCCLKALIGLAPVVLVEICWDLNLKKEIQAKREKELEVQGCLRIRRGTILWTPAVTETVHLGNALCSLMGHGSVAG